MEEVEVSTTIPCYFEFLDQYEIRRDGIIISKKTGEPKATRLDGKGYPRVNLYSRKKRKHVTIRVHRLVAAMYLPNPDGLRVVNHKDGVRSNPHVDNLEWCDDIDNARHREAMKRGELEMYYNNERRHIS